MIFYALSSSEKFRFLPKSIWHRNTSADIGPELNVKTLGAHKRSLNIYICIKNVFLIFFANFSKIKQKRANFSRIFISSVYPYSLSKFWCLKTPRRFKMRYILKRERGEYRKLLEIERTTVNVSCETYGFIRECLLRTITMCDCITFS